MRIGFAMMCVFIYLSLRFTHLLQHSTLILINRKTLAFVLLTWMKLTKNSRQTGTQFSTKSILFFYYKPWHLTFSRYDIVLKLLILLRVIYKYLNVLLLLDFMLIKYWFSIKMLEKLIHYFSKCSFL